MKRILLVDDNYTEQTREISEIVNSFDNCELLKSTSVTEAIKQLTKQPIDILITDIQLPTRLGDDIDKLGGIKLIEALEERSDRIIMPSYVIGITSHVDSLSMSQDFFDQRGFKVLLASDIKEKFKSILRNQFKYITPRHEYDVAIITALHAKEFEQILSLPLNIQELETIGSHTYYSGKFIDSEGEERSVIATHCTRMGSPSAATSAAYLISRYKPKLIAMTGIAGGIDKGISFGDIIAADSCWDWESGKRTKKGGEPEFRIASDPIRLDTEICSLFQKYSVNRSFLDKIQDSWKLGNNQNRLNLHVGPMVSGSSVMEDEGIVEGILTQHRKILAIEMEAYGVALAARLAPTPTKCLILKSISDFADTDKNDNYQDYAAYTSAQLLFHYLTTDFSIND